MKHSSECSRRIERKVHADDKSRLVSCGFRPLVRVGPGAQRAEATSSCLIPKLGGFFRVTRRLCWRISGEDSFPYLRSQQP